MIFICTIGYPLKVFIYVNKILQKQEKLFLSFPVILYKYASKYSKHEM